jgi:hypothetical protein
VAGHVAYHAPIPVFILRAHSDTNMSADVDLHGIDSPHADHPRRVIAPLDGSPLAETALEPARVRAGALARPGSAVIRLALFIAPDRIEREYMPEALLIDGATSYTSERRRYLAVAQVDDWTRPSGVLPRSAWR